MPNIVYIATSLDGYITDKDGGLDWLGSVPNPNNDDLGWADFIAQIDALVMGRKTFDAVCSFDQEWPYPVPVFVLSNSLSSIPDGYADKAELVSGSLKDVVAELNLKGFNRLYIDGGQTIQSFLSEDLIDEIIITRIPILLGGGTPLFGTLPNLLDFDLVNNQILLGAMEQGHYCRKR
ncbi:dihydrofolate reductase family protein [Amphritea balenae]|uniref:Dihydrofolate reductase n=1 Tax=Amphritea balenae TaxID=452629 RepID=A0A3P1SPY0_9GAMM|nr:dihydrofolate reductase family protein [Amphritea balenae]RRC99311.1 dihydrofolate reductase [Amphritea balenae]GGK72116.1 diacylglycerol kinase [Amphritea balenae]